MSKALTYHVFADNLDYWFDTLDEATQSFDELCKDYENVRIYWEVLENSDVVDENYLNGQGEYPL